MRLLSWALGLNVKGVVAHLSIYSLLCSCARIIDSIAPKSDKRSGSSSIDTYIELLYAIAIPEVWSLSHTSANCWNSMRALTSSGPRYLLSHF